DTIVEPKLASPTKRLLLLQLQSMPVAVPVPPARNGAPGTGVSPPADDMLYMETELLATRATARNLPSGVTLIPAGDPPGPASKGDPATAVRAPFAAIL